LLFLPFFKRSFRSPLFLCQPGTMKYCYETLSTRPGNRHLQPLRRMLPLAPHHFSLAVQTPSAALSPRARAQRRGRLFPCRLPLSAPARRGVRWQRNKDVGLCDLRDPAGYLPGLLRKSPEWREAVLRARRMFNGGRKGWGAGKSCARWEMNRVGMEYLLLGQCCVVQHGGADSRVGVRHVSGRSGHLPARLLEGM
jgi:hypothetical protein